MISPVRVIFTSRSYLTDGIFSKTEVVNVCLLIARNARGNCTKASINMPMACSW